MTEQTLAQFQAVLQKHRANEQIYRQKVKQINLTRGKISDQLQVLQQNYDKKLKGLQQKLQKLKTQNQELIRQNILYKSQIQTYQSRLLQKQKIIAMLFIQHKDLPIITNSQKSKSDKTQSLNANQQQSKSFKKQGTNLKQDYEHPIIQKVQEEANVQIQTKSKQEDKTNHNYAPRIQSNQQEVKIPKKIPPPPIKKKKIPTPSKSIQSQNKPVQLETKSQQKIVQVVIPKPVEKSKRRVPPPKKPEPAEQISRNETSEASDFFKNINLNQYQQSNEVYQRQQQITSKNKSKNRIEEQEIAPNNYEQNQLKNFEYKQSNLQVEQENIYIDQQIVEKQQESKYAQNHIQSNQMHQYHSKFEFENKNYGQEQERIPQQENQDIQDQSNNFLSHFNKNYHQNTYQAQYQQPPPKPKNKKAKKHFEIQRQVTGSDFFSQLAKNQSEPHNLEIQQSSIDHIDRDSSLISNQQPYFAQQSVAVKSKPVKMPKKKGRRDQVKQMDPSIFG